MTVYFVSRHPGAAEWAEREGVAFDQHEAHLDADRLRNGDTVIGTLPVHTVARIRAAGVRYLHLAFDLPAGLRGAELSADDLARLNARLVPIHAEVIHVLH